MKVLGQSEPGSAGKELLPFFSLFEDLFIMDSKMNTLRGNNFLPPRWKNWDIVSRGGEPSNSCTHALLQEIKINASCVIMKWHFLEQMLTNSDSTGMQTMKLAQTGKKVVADQPLMTKGPGLGV